MGHIDILHVARYSRHIRRLSPWNRVFWLIRSGGRGLTPNAQTDFTLTHPTCQGQQKVGTTPLPEPPQSHEGTNKVPTTKSQAQRPAPSTHSPTIDSTQINAPIHTSIPYPVTAKNEVCPVLDLVPASCCDSDAARERWTEAGQTFGCRLHATSSVGWHRWHNVVTCSPQ